MAIKYTCKPLRKFTIPQEASIADPSRQIACWEVVEGGTVSDPAADTHVKSYTDFSELKKIITEFEEQKLWDEGYSAGVESVLKTLGLGERTYIQLMDLKAKGSVVSIYMKVSEPIEIKELVDDIQGVHPEWGSLDGVKPTTASLLKSQNTTGSGSFVDTAITFTNRIEDKTDGD